MNARDYAGMIAARCCVACGREAVASRCPPCAETEAVRARLAYRRKNPDGKRRCTRCGELGHYAKTCPRE